MEVVSSVELNGWHVLLYPLEGYDIIGAAVVRHYIRVIIDVIEESVDLSRVDVMELIFLVLLHWVVDFVVGDEVQRSVTEVPLQAGWP